MEQEGINNKKKWIEPEIYFLAINRTFESIDGINEDGFGYES